MGSPGTDPVLISLAQFLCVAEQGAVMQGQKKPRARLEAGNCLEAFQGKGRDGGDRHSAEGTLAFLVAQSYSQIHRGVARIRLRRQVGAASCKQAVEIRAQLPCRGSTPPGQAQGAGTPKSCLSWLSSPTMTGGLLCVSPSSELRRRPKRGSSPLPSRASTHLTWLPRTA